MTTVSTLNRSRAAAGSAGYLPTPSELGDVAGHRTVVPKRYLPTPPYLRNMTARGGYLALQNYGTWGRGGYLPHLVTGTLFQIGSTLCHTGVPAGRSDWLFTIN